MNIFIRQIRQRDRLWHAVQNIYNTTDIVRINSYDLRTL